MISKATDASIAALGGNRPGSDITARPVTAIKAGPVALYFAWVIEGHTEYSGCSDLSPSSILSGGVEADPNSQNCFGNASNPLVVSGHAQRMTNTSLKTAINIAGVAPRPLNFPRGPLSETTCTLHDQKQLVSPARRCGNAETTFCCAYRSVRHHERPLPWKASRLRDSSAGFCLEETMGLKSGGSEAWQGTLTITGSNARLGAEMPVALSSFSI